MSGNSVLKPDLTIFLTYIKMREKNDSNKLSFSEYKGMEEGNALDSL